jgi:hypothetical protein
MIDFKKPFPLLVLLVLLIPNHSFAQSLSGFSNPIATIVAQPITTKQELSSELDQTLADLNDANTTASFTLSPGQSIQQAAGSSTNGSLWITLPSFLHTQSVLSQASTTQLVKINLQYNPCVTTANTAGIPTGVNVCTAGPSPFPVMSSELALGQSTNYLTYNIALTQLTATSATLQVTDSSYLASIQDRITAIAAKVRAFLGQ